MGNSVIRVMIMDKTMNKRAFRLY